MSNKKCSYADNDKILEEEKHATSFIEKLQQASNEIDSIKYFFSNGK